MDVKDARTIGARLRQIRNSRGKLLRVIAGLAGISKSQLSEIEYGERALDSLKQLVALANVLQIAPGELTRLPVPAPDPCWPCGQRGTVAHRPRWVWLREAACT